MDGRSADFEVPKAVSASKQEESPKWVRLVAPEIPKDVRLEAASPWHALDRVLSALKEGVGIFPFPT